MEMKRLVVAALEVRRRYSEAGAVHVDQQPEVQRQRRNNTAWLDVAAIFLRPMDDLRSNQVAALEKLQSSKWMRMSDREMVDAEDGLGYFERYYKPKDRREILRQMYNIADKM